MEHMYDAPPGFVRVLPQDRILHTLQALIDDVDRTRHAERGLWMGECLPLPWSLVAGGVAGTAASCAKRRWRVTCHAAMALIGK